MGDGLLKKNFLSGSGDINLELLCSLQNKLKCVGWSEFSRLTQATRQVVAKKNLKKSSEFSDPPGPMQCCCMIFVFLTNERTRTFTMRENNRYMSYSAVAWPGGIKITPLMKNELIFILERHAKF